MHSAHKTLVCACLHVKARYRTVMTGMSDVGARPQRDRAATRQRLLDAARLLFAEHGYDHVTVRMIAAAAEANVALINRYFGSKSALFAEGMACTGAYDCADGLLCLGSPLLCKKAPHLGDACPDNGCAELGADCVNGTCVAIGLAGDPCPTGNECAPFYTCVTGSCVAPDAMPTPPDPPVCLGTQRLARSGKHTPT